MRSCMTTELDTWRQEDGDGLPVQVRQQRFLLCALVGHRQVEAVLLLGCKS